MGLADGELVSIEFAQLCRELKQFLHTDGEVRSIEQCSAAPVRDLFHLGEASVPAGGAYDDAAAKGEHSADILRGSFGRSEVDDHIDSGEVWSRQRRGMPVFLQVVYAHTVTAFARYFGDHGAGFTFTKDKN